MGYIGQSLTDVAKENGIPLQNKCQLLTPNELPICITCHVIIPEDFKKTLIAPTKMEEETLKNCSFLSQK